MYKVNKKGPSREPYGSFLICEDDLPMETKKERFNKMLAISEM
jgi:hypothetical protein